MTPTLTIDIPQKSSEFQHPFLEELIREIRNSDTNNYYYEYSNEFLINQLIISSEKNTSGFLENLKKLSINAFYRAIGINIERKTGHPTETFIHFKDQKIGSAVICCGRVVVFTSLMSGYLSFGFLSLQELIRWVEVNIENAVGKASLYLDFPT